MFQKILIIDRSVYLILILLAIHLEFILSQPTQHLDQILKVDSMKNKQIIDNVVLEQCMLTTNE